MSERAGGAGVGLILGLEEGKGGITGLDGMAWLVSWLMRLRLRLRLRY